jgi:hypothetical protein
VTGGMSVFSEFGSEAAHRLANVRMVYEAPGVTPRE